MKRELFPRDVKGFEKILPKERIVETLPEICYVDKIQVMKCGVDMFDFVLRSFRDSIDHDQYGNLLNNIYYRENHMYFEMNQCIGSIFGNVVLVRDTNVPDNELRLHRISKERDKETVFFIRIAEKEKQTNE